MPKDDEAPLMPQDSVLRRIDDDLALADRRAARDWVLPDEIDTLMALREAHEERSADEAAKVQGAPRRRRQITSGLGFNAYWRLPVWQQVLWITATVALVVVSVLSR